MRRFYALSRAVGFAGLLCGLSSGVWGQTFTSAGSITVTNGSANAYGTGNAAIGVSGLSGSLTSVSLKLSGVSGFPAPTFDQLGFVLQSPGGINFEFWSGGCDANGGAPSGDFTFADTNSSFTGVSCSGGGSFQATDYFAGQDTYPTLGTIDTAHSAASPNCSPCGTGTFNTGSGGLFKNLTNNALNGTWKLFIADVGGSNSGVTGTITSWSLTFTVTGAGASTTTTLAAGSPNPSFTSGSSSTVGFTATVTSGGNAVITGTVALHDVTTNTDLVTGVALNGSGQATLSAVMPVQGPNIVEAVYSGASGFQASTSNTQTQTAWNHATNPSGNTYCNDGSNSAVSIPLGNPNGVAASPYPDEMILGNGQAGQEVGSTGLVQSISVELDTLSYPDFSNLGFMLVSPGGTAYEFMSQAGGGGVAPGPVTLTFSDSASTSLSQNTIPTTGTYKPTSDVCSPGCNTPPDPYPSPAPASFSAAFPHGTTTLNEAFGGQGIIGAWKLYISTRGNDTNNPGSIHGWCMAFSLQTGATGTQTVVTSSKNPATQGVDNVTFTATVTASDSSVVNAGSVSFTDGTTTIGTAGVVNGTASVSTSTLSEGTHQILASYSGTNTGKVYGVSSGTVDQRIDDATVRSSLQFCNNGTISLPAPNTSLGPDSPYPSNINVANMPGTVKSFTLTLESFQASVVDWIDSLVVGPNGSDLDFFSNAGGPGAFGPPGANLIFSDAASGTVPNGSFSAGTYKPTSYGSTANTYQACPSNAPGCQTPPVGPPAPQETYNYAQPHGSATFASAFGTGPGNTTFTGNGEWSLYQALNAEGANDGSETGWCLTFTQNPPALTGTKGPSGAMVTQGQSSSITVVVHNTNGPGGAGGVLPVSVSDTFPSGLTPTGGSGTDWSCGSPSGQSITCTSSDFIAQGNDFPTLTINYTAAGNATTGTANNTAQISGSGMASPVNTNTLGITVQPAPVLAVSKMAIGTFTQGSTGEWDISVTNTASGSTTQGTTTVIDTLPSGETVANFGATSGSWSCSGTGTQTATCTTTQAVSGGSAFATLQVIANIPTTSLTSVTNNVSAYGGGDLTHTNSTNAVMNSASATVVQVPTTIVLNNGQTLSATVGTAYVSLAITLKDAAGNLIKNYNGVTFTATTGGGGASGTFSNTTNTIKVSTDSNGVADPGTFTANTKVGSFNVNVTPSTGSATGAFNLTNVAGTATQLIASSGTPQTVTVGMAAGMPLVATAEDQYNNPVSGVSVTFTAPGSGPSGTFSNSMGSITGTTNASGQLSESYMANTAAGGPYNVTASASGTNSVNFSITNAAGVPTTVTATSGGGQTTNVNTQFTNPLVATVTDANGNPVSGVDVTFTPVPNMNGATCVLASAGGMARTPVSVRNGRGGRTGTLKPHDDTSVDVITGTNGIAEATCTANGTAGAYSVTAAASGATSASFGLTNNAGTVQITVATNISGPTITVDGGMPFTGSQMFQWTPNTSHTIATTSPQTNGTTQYVWLNWSDNGAISHMVSGPSTATTYTANFKTQYQLTTNVNIAAGGTISPATGFYDAGSNINITATPNSPQYVFVNFTGDLGSTTSPLPITLSGPLSETANFTGGPTSLGMTVTGKTGPTSARVWTIAIGNNGPGVAVGAEIANMTFAIQSGPACTPVVSGLPAMVSGGPIAAQSTGSASVNINFTGCASNTLFKVTTVLSANNGNATSTVVKGSQLP